MQLRHLVSSLALAAPASMFAQAGAYQEVGGLAVVELESAEGDLGDWRLERDVAGYTGGGYLFYGGPGYGGQPGNSPLEFLVDIQTVGTYQVKWHSYIAMGTSNTDHNDSWVRVPDAAEFFARKGEQRRYPKGSGREPHPAGASADGWFKAYQNSSGKWSWRTATNDHDPFEIVFRVDEPGVQRIQISGRSQGHAIDRLVLRHVDVPQAMAEDLSRPESARATGTSPSRDLALGRELAVWPNPASATLRATLPAGALGDDASVTLVDQTGRRYDLSGATSRVGDALEVSVASVPRGLYRVQVASPTGAYAGQVLVR